MQSKVTGGVTGGGEMGYEGEPPDGARLTAVDAWMD